MTSHIYPQVNKNGKISSTNLTEEVSGAIDPEDDLDCANLICETLAVSGLTPNAVVTTDGSSNITGVLTLGETQGGTGNTTYATGDTLYASGTNTLSKLTIGSTGQQPTVTAGGIPAYESNIKRVSYQYYSTSAYTSVSGSSYYLTQSDTIPDKTTFVGYTFATFNAMSPRKSTNFIIIHVSVHAAADSVTMVAIYTEHSNAAIACVSCTRNNEATPMIGIAARIGLNATVGAPSGTNTRTYQVRLYTQAVSNYIRINARVGASSRAWGGVSHSSASLEETET